MLSGGKEMEEVIVLYIHFVKVEMKPKLPNYVFSSNNN